MGKTVFRPFWSYDVQKTERWLSEMAGKGWRFVCVNFFTRIFRFESGDHENSVYRIQCEAPTVDNARKFTSWGWRTAFYKGRWHFLSSESADGEAHPLSRGGILSRNTNYFIAAMVVFLVAVIVLVPIWIFTDIMMSSMLDEFGAADVTVEPTPIGVYLVMVAFIIALGFLLYASVKLWRTNKSLRAEDPQYPDLSFTIPKENLLDRATERRLLKEKKIIRKWKTGWMYGPDKFEQWLEDMESKGFNLYRANRMWTLYYFIVGKPRKVKFHAEYQDTASGDYFESHKQDGWQLRFASAIGIQKFTIWSREYSEGEPEPQFYTDKSEMVMQAKKLITFSWMYGVFTVGWIVLGILNAINIYNSYLNYPDDATSLPLFIITIVLYPYFGIVFGSFALRPVLYYRRVKHQVDGR